MERKEVTIYGMTVDDSRSVPIQAFDNGDGTYSLRTSPGNEAIVRASWTDRSGTIGVGNTSQQIMAANPNRQILWIQNISATNLWVAFNTDAIASTPGNFLLVASGGFLGLPEGVVTITDSVSIVGNTAGLAYTAKEA